MKQFAFFTVFLIVLCGYYSVTAQISQTEPTAATEVKFYATTDGSLLETSTYSANGVATGKSVFSVQNNSLTQDAEVTTVQNETFNAASASIGNVSYCFLSRGTSSYVDMKKYLSPQMMKLFEDKDLNISIQTAEIEIPNSNTTVGQTFSEATLIMTLSGNEIPFETFSIRIYNRVVIGSESLVTPAGTYQCKKITFDMETTSAGKTITRWTEWWAPEVGCVKTEYFDAQGKLIGSELLTSVSE